MDKQGEEFITEREVRQRDPLSPNLFNCILLKDFRDLNWEGKRSKIDAEFLNNIRFADDVVLVGKNKEEFKKMAKEFIKHSGEAGLEVNPIKTKILINTCNDGEVVIEDVKIERLEEIVYLGQTSLKIVIRKKSPKG